MPRSILTVFAIVLSTSISFAQVTFKKGYFTDKQGNKTECFIKDVDWNYSPSSFNYRLTESGDVQKMDTGEISEFLVGDVKYVRTLVQYDQSSQELKKAGITSNPQWVQGDLLLKVLIEGKATLYQYNSKEYLLYFFSVDKSPIEQLIFKYYLNPKDVTQLVENRMYLTQLTNKVNCNGVVALNSKEVPYQKKPLTDYFRKFNICSGEVVTEAPKTTRSLSLRLTPGLDLASATSKVSGGRSYDFGHNTSFRLGFEAQFTLPFNHGKWALIAEPTYVSFNGRDKKYDVTLKYTSIETPIGLRYKIFLPEKSNYFFVNAAAVVDYPLKHEQSYVLTTVEDFNKVSVGFTAGAGFAYGRFSLEGRYYPTRQRSLEGIVVYHYTKSSIIFGIRIF